MDTKEKNTKSVTILIDTREKDMAAITSVCKACNARQIPCDICKLYTGDVAAAANQSLVIERKKDLQELVSNLTGCDRSRFFREIERAQTAGQEVAIVVTQAGYYGPHGWVDLEKVEDVVDWTPLYGPAVTGGWMHHELAVLEASYPVKVYFCRPSEYGETAVGLIERHIN